MNRAGEYITNLQGEARYRSFRPSPLPPKDLQIDEETVSLLSRTSRALAKLDAETSKVPNMDMFISMYVRKEALLSSQLEGTQATLEDVLDPSNEKNANQDVSDVIRYIEATEFALAKMRKLPLCNRLLKETHKVLMSGVRGQEKNPGEFRRSQNWIGAAGSTLKTARYIPPNPDDMKNAMTELENYINSDDGNDVLIQTALIHYQFETIHPFLDGNGRIGRLLIMLFLMDKGILHSPSLYISYFLKKNRTEYYDRLSEVRNKNDYEQWIKFFLYALLISAEDASETISKLAELHDRNTAWAEHLGRSKKTALLLLGYLEKNPIINITKTAAELNISFTTVSSAVKKFTEAGILSKPEEERNRIFVYKEYLDILRKDT